jgi:hypothetical protein
MQRVGVAAAAATVLALASGWHSGRHVWHRIQQDHATLSAYTPVERTHAPATWVGIDATIFDWYRQYLAKGDRFYLQVDPQHDPHIAQMLAGYYLLPAAEVSDPSSATVVVSYFSNPNTLGLHFLTQEQAGEQPLFVSRISAP